ncbi:MAG: ABC transporter permease [Ferrimicrobium sp.]
MVKLRRLLARAWREERLGVFTVSVLCTMALLAIFAPLYTQSPDVIHPLNQLQPPSLAHWFGTDDFGRDIFSRTMYAGRVSLGLGLVVTVVVSVVGGVLGLIAGYLRALDGFIMRIMDGMMAFPPIILAIALVAVMGPGLLSEFMALSVVFTPRMARVVRGTTLQLKGAEYIDAARISGSRGVSIVRQHIVPNGIAPLIVQASFTYAEVVLADAVLSFLGLGVAPPTPSWGNMISEASTFLTSDPWFAIFPGLAIVVSVVSLNIAGDSIRSLVGQSSVQGHGGRRRRGRMNNAVETPTEPGL